MSATPRMLRCVARVGAGLAIVAIVVAGAVSASVSACGHPADDADRVRPGAGSSREVGTRPGATAKPVPEAFDHEPGSRESAPVEHLIIDTRMFTSSRNCGSTISHSTRYRCVV